MSDAGIFLLSRYLINIKRYRRREGGVVKSVLKESQVCYIYMSYISGNKLLSRLF